MIIASAAAIVSGCCLIGGKCKAYSPVIDEGFTSLFNGKDLKGWFGSKNYVVETIDVKLNNGTVSKVPVIVCRPVDNLGGNLLTEKQYRNFVLRFDFLMPENGNNGLGIRVPNEKVNAAYDGMCELQLLDDGGSSFYDAKAGKDKLKPYQYTGSVYGIVPSRRDNFNCQIWGKDKNFAGGGS